jgi:tRNA A-37 threonylcarbamoyl transferase component Bud32
MNAEISITRRQLNALNPVLIASGNSFAQADIFKIEMCGQSVIVKDFIHRPWIFRATIGRLFLKREVRALKQLASISNVPKILGVVDGYAFIMSIAPGQRLPDRWAPPPSLQTLNRLKTLVEQIHARGIAHNDLRRTNIFYDQQETPYIIDFATALFKSNKDSDPIFNKAAMLDKIKIAKIKQAYYPQRLTEHDNRLLTQGAFYKRLSAFWKDAIYRPFLKQARWRERMQRWKIYFWAR